MLQQLKVHRPAVRVRGKVYEAPKAGMKHVDVIARFGLPGKPERGFTTSEGKFVGREEGAKIAIAAGQVGGEVTRLHSEDLPDYKRLHARIKD